MRVGEEEKMEKVIRKIQSLQKNKEKSSIRLRLANNKHLPYILPAMITMTILSIVPTLFLIIISFTDYQLGWEFSRAKFVVFENFLRLFTGADRDFWHSVYISFGFMILATAIELLLGFFNGYILNSSEFKMKPIVIGIMIIPLVITPSIAAQMWKLMLNSEYGIINYILNLVVHGKVIWLSDKMAFWTVLLVDFWQYTPFVTLILYAGFRSVPEEPYESASIDGANKYQKLKYITIPMMKKLILLTILFRVIDSLKLFDVAFVLTQGGPGTATEFLSLHIYRMANAQNGLIGRAAAIALVLLFLVTLFSKILIKQMRKEE